MKKEKDPWQLEMDMSSNVVTKTREIKEPVPDKKFMNIVLEDEKKKSDEKEIIGRNKNFIVVDIETTGIKPQAERITEIVALRYNYNWDYMGAVYHNLLNPVKKIPREIVEITKITQDMVKYKPYGTQGVNDFAKGINFGEDILVAHNAKFEYDWLTHYNGTFKLANWICTRAIYLFMRDGNTWDNNYKKNYSRLKQVCEFYGIEYIETDAHRAEYDVIKTVAVAKHMIKKIGIKRCIDITEAYVHGKGYGRKKVKYPWGTETVVEATELTDYEKSSLPKFEEEKSLCAGADLGAKGKEGGIYD